MNKKVAISILNAPIFQLQNIIDDYKNLIIFGKVHEIFINNKIKLYPLEDEEIDELIDKGFLIYTLATYFNMFNDSNEEYISTENIQDDVSIYNLCLSDSEFEIDESLVEELNNKKTSKVPNMIDSFDSFDQEELKYKVNTETQTEALPTSKDDSKYNPDYGFKNCKKCNRFYQCPECVRTKDLCMSCRNF